MSEVDEAFKDRRESLLNKIDYAISIIDLNEYNLENVKRMLIDIEKEVKAL